MHIALGLAAASAISRCRKERGRDGGMVCIKSELVPAELLPGPMTAWGQKLALDPSYGVSALPPKAAAALADRGGS